MDLWIKLKSHMFGEAGLSLAGDQKLVWCINVALPPCDRAAKSQQLVRSAP